MVAVEGATAIPGDGARPTETERARPTLPGARQNPETTRARGSWRGHEGNHQEVFSRLAATGQAATKNSFTNGEVPCSASVRTSAAMR